MKVCELLTDKTKWTQFAVARDADGMEVDPDSDKAQSFCLIGAIIKCYSKNSDQDMIHKIVRPHLFDASFLSEWNDADPRTFEDVKSLVTMIDI
jgi:hypothetical protein